MQIVCRSQIHVQCSLDHAFRVTSSPETMVKAFRGYGPIPGITSIHQAEKGDQAGAIRVVHNSDGSRIEEEITDWREPELFAYRMVRGIRYPFRLLVNGGEGEWRFEPQESGALVSWTFAWNLTSLIAWPLTRLVAIFFCKAMDDCLCRIQEMSTKSISE